MLILIQNFGFSVTFSCGMRILLGTLVKAALALLTLPIKVETIRVLTGGRRSLAFTNHVRLK